MAGMNTNKICICRFLLLGVFQFECEMAEKVFFVCFVSFAIFKVVSVFDFGFITNLLSQMKPEDESLQRQRPLDGWLFATSSFKNKNLFREIKCLKRVAIKFMAICLENIEKRLTVINKTFLPPLQI